MKILVISFSGGKTSALMAKLLIEKYYGKRRIIVVFSNTGDEREETLEFVRDCDKCFGLETVWLESVQFHGERKGPGFRIVNFETASRSGEPFEDMIKKHGIPNKAFPTCSRELKQRPIKAYLKSIGVTDYEMALGIRIDEPKRLTNKPGVIYPMAYEFPRTKLMVNKWWYNQPFNLNLKGYEGNCSMCWKKSKRKLLTLIVEHPERAKWWAEMEAKYGEYVPAGQTGGRVTPITFFRENESMKDLIEESKFPFILSKDDFTLNELMFSKRNWILLMVARKVVNLFK